MSEPEEDFGAMFEASASEARREGSGHRGPIVAIGPEVALVDVGGKGEAVIDVGELKENRACLESPWATGSRRRWYRPPAG